MRIKKNSSLARAIIILDRTRQNADVKAPSLIMADLVRILKYHIKRLSPDNISVLKRFSFCLFFHKPDCGYQAMEGREMIEIINCGYIVAVTMREYYMEKKVRLAIANENLRKSGFFYLVSKVIENKSREYEK